jgi:hypothetical protein
MSRMLKHCLLLYRSVFGEYSPSLLLFGASASVPSRLKTKHMRPNMEKDVVLKNQSQEYSHSYLNCAMFLIHHEVKQK